MNANNDALRDLPAKWRTIAAGEPRGAAKRLRSCADELDAAIRALSAARGEAAARAGDGDAVAWRTETPYGVGYLFADELIEAGVCLEGKPPSPAESAEGGAYETRADGQRVRKDRWETGFRNIVTAIVGPRTEFEIPDIVERVRLLATAAAPSQVSDADAKRAIEARNKCLQKYPGDAVRAMRAALEAAQPQPGRVDG